MIRRYDMSDYPMLCKWLTFRGIPNPDADFFSDTGFVADEKAIGFLFKTNSKTCYIDHIAADPHCDIEDRDKSLNTLFSYLQLLAYGNGFRLITVLAKLEPMKHRFETHGFKAFDDYTLYYKPLKKDELCLG